VDANEAFEPILAFNATSRLQVWSVGIFYNMENDPHSMVKDQFSRRDGGIFLLDWKLRFQT